MLRKIIINMIAWGGIGGFLASAGVMFNASWEFWAINICVIIIQINQGID